MASKAVTLDMLAHYDQKNPEAMMRLVAQGVKISIFPNEVLARLHDEAEAYYKETSAANPAFAKMFDHQRDFMKKSYTYQKVADFQYDLMMLRLRG